MNFVFNLGLFYKVPYYVYENIPKSEALIVPSISGKGYSDSRSSKFSFTLLYYLLLSADWFSEFLSNRHLHLFTEHLGCMGTTLRDRANGSLLSDLKISFLLFQSNMSFCFICNTEL